MKASVFIATSLDGYIARPDGDIDWLHATEPALSDEDYGYHAFMDSVDALVMGRHSFEKVLTFRAWPYGEKRVIVLSSRPVPLPASLPDTVESRSLAPAALLEQLEGQGLRHVYVDGGKTIQGFLRAGLIDELIITRIPRLIGDGIPLFGALDEDVVLEHVGTQAYANGLVQSKYKVGSTAPR